MNASLISRCFLTLVATALSVLVIVGCVEREESDEIDSLQKAKKMISSATVDQSQHADETMQVSAEVPVVGERQQAVATDETRPENQDESHADEKPTAESKDPHKYREELAFEKWDKPQCAILISGRQHGYIEPCGCTGLTNQKGGMLRRDSLRRNLEEKKGWDLLKIDAGNQIRRFGVQPRVKFGTSIQSLAKVMKYDVIGLGPDDLRLSGIDLLSNMENNLPDPDNSPFTSANIGLLDDHTYLPDIRIVNKAGKKFGVVAVLGDEFHEQINNAEISFKTCDQALTEVVPRLKQEKCDFTVLIAMTSLERSEELAKKFPVFNLLITTGGAGEPTHQPREIKAENGHVTSMVQVGTKGMYAGVIGLYAGKENALRYSRVPLDDRFEDSEEMKKVFVQYQETIKRIGLRGLGLLPAPPYPTAATYVGSEKCADCHDYAYEVWKNGIKELGDKFGPHAHATDSLINPNERVWVTRFNDPECLSCHATGWNPQKYFPYAGGLVDLEKKHLFGNGCENCHGPGSKHVDFENGDLKVSKEEGEKILQEMVLTVEEARTTKCMECHDLDNSPDFHVDGAFEKYWKRIIHNE